MYKRIVRRKLEATFAAASERDPTPMLDTLASSFSYRFAGTNALSGVRTTRGDVAAWWERIFSLFPGVRFSVLDAVVSGPPWRTLLATHVVLTAPRDDGSVYRNEFMQLMRLRWGKATDILTLEDTGRCDDELDDRAAAGHLLAHAAPIGAPSAPPGEAPAMARQT